jgi:autotransporter translocation and assembly factor TamB
MRIALRIVAWFALVVVVLIVVAVGTAYVLTQTSFGRERVRRIALGFAQKAIHGHVHIGQLGGNLLANPTIDSLSITDSSGAPFVTARRVTLYYGLGSVIRQRLNFRQVEVDDPVVVLDQSPAGTWNFSRIFPRRTHRPIRRSTGSAIGSRSGVCASSMRA